eukprot:760627-Hanusia_phi.AAC.1
MMYGTVVRRAGSRPSVGLGRSHTPLKTVAGERGVDGLPHSLPSFPRLQTARDVRGRRQPHKTLPVKESFLELEVLVLYPAGARRSSVRRF